MIYWVGLTKEKILLSKQQKSFLSRKNFFCCIPYPQSNCKNIYIRDTILLYDFDIYSWLYFHLVSCSWTSNFKTRKYSSKTVFQSKKCFCIIDDSCIIKDNVWLYLRIYACPKAIKRWKYKICLIIINERCECKQPVGLSDLTLAQRPGK